MIYMKTNQFKGKTLSWELKDGVIELALHRDPCNEIGSRTLEELEKFASALEDLHSSAHALILYSTLKTGFCAGADLRELYHGAQGIGTEAAARGVREFLDRIHNVLNAIDSSPLTTIAALNGVTFGGGFELALVCDLIIADNMARFGFPELRLGLIPRLRRNPAPEAGSGQCRGSRSITDGAQLQRHESPTVGLVSQVVGEGESLRAARGTATQLENLIAARRLRPRSSSSRSR